MSNLPNWAVGLLFLAAIVFLGVIHMGPTLKPAVIDVAQLAAQGQEIEEGFYAAPVVHTRTGEVLWARLENASFPMHYHGQNEIVFALQGQATMKLLDGTSTTLNPGQLIVIPAGTATGFEVNADILLFSTPPENDRDTVWLEGPMAKPGAKAPSREKPTILDAVQRMAQGLDQQREGFQFTFIYRAKTGSVELFRIDRGVALHKHPKENHVLYILKGRGLGTIGDKTAEVGRGQIVVIPANIPHKLDRIGDEPLEFILFSTPPFDPNDIVWLK